MLLILRQDTAAAPPSLKIRAVRQTPAYVEPHVGKTDYFVELEREEADKLASDEATVVHLKDGWYETTEGGVAIWGDGRYFEIRAPYHTAESGESSA